MTRLGRRKEIGMLSITSSVWQFSTEEFTNKEEEELNHYCTITIVEVSNVDNQSFRVDVKVLGM